MLLHHHTAGMISSAFKFGRSNFGNIRPFCSADITFVSFFIDPLTERHIVHSAIGDGVFSAHGAHAFFSNSTLAESYKTLRAPRHTRSVSGQDNRTNNEANSVQMQQSHAINAGKQRIGRLVVEL